jgi:D-sedoheptulose 7-phosphate isomerase
MTERWDDYLGTIADGLRDLRVTDRAGAAVPVDDAFGRWVDMTLETHERGGCVYFVGNGGSAGMASHMATDACKGGHMRAHAFNDPTMLTAIGNDLGYDQVFSLPLERLGRAGDLVVSISSSGNSPNIVRALETARRLGLAAVTLSGRQPDNRSRALGDLNFYVPLARYGWVESAHLTVVHHWLDEYLSRYCGGAI